MSAPNGIHRALRLALSFWLLSAATLAAQAPRPDAKALDAAWRLKRSGASASAVAREMLSDYRQTGPQTIVILTTTGYREAEVGRALAGEARADAGTMASWAAAAALETTSAWQMVRSVGASGGEATKAMRGSGFGVSDLLRARQSLERPDLAEWVADLRFASVGAVEVGDALSAVTRASAKTAAEEMLEAGYSVVEVAAMLRDSYGLRDEQVGMLLTELGVDAVQVLTAWLDPAYGLGEPDAIDAFSEIGGSAEHAAFILRDRGRSAAQIAFMLSSAGYGATEVGDAIQSAVGLPTGAVVDAMVDGGMQYAAVAEWADHNGQAEPVIVNLIEAAGATATENASALLAGSVIVQSQYGAWSMWAGAADYTCAQTASALKDAFLLPAEVTAMTLPTAGCDPGDIGKAINNVYDPSPAGLATALVAAGFDTLELAQALHSALTDPVVVAAAMKSVNKSMNEIATALRELGITPAAIAQVLLDVFNPTPIAVAFALKAAGCTQPEVQEAILGVFTLNLQQVAEILATVF